MPLRKTVQHFHETGPLHELTFSCRHRLPLLTNDDSCRLLARGLDAVHAQLGFPRFAFVFMTEHVPMLVFPNDESASLSLDLARLKQPFSKQIQQILAARGNPLVDRWTVQERSGKTCVRFWQEGSGFDQNLFGAKAIKAGLNDVPENPVGRDLCEGAIDWRWSSAGLSLLNPPTEQEADLPLVQKVPYDLLN